MHVKKKYDAIQKWLQQSHLNDILLGGKSEVNWN